MTDFVARTSIVAAVEIASATYVTLVSDQDGQMYLWNYNDSGSNDIDFTSPSTPAVGDWIVNSADGILPYLVKADDMSDSFLRMPNTTLVDALTSLTDNSGGTGNDTIAAITNIALLVDNSGGTPADTIAAITDLGNANSADLAPTKNAIASLAEELIAQRTVNTNLTNAVADLARKVNAIITALQG